jgi:hypothetical protein
MPNTTLPDDKLPSLYFILSPYFAREQDENEEAKSAFLNAFSELSDQLQDFLTAPETADKLEEVGDMFELRLAQTEIVSFLIREIVLGRLPLKDFPTAIERACKVDNQIAWQIANTLAASLLMPIKEDLVHVQKRSPTAPQTPSQPLSSGQGAQLHNIIDLRTKTSETPTT